MEEKVGQNAPWRRVRRRIILETGLIRSTITKLMLQNLDSDALNGKSRLNPVLLVRWGKRPDIGQYRNPLSLTSGPTGKTIPIISEESRPTGSLNGECPMKATKAPSRTATRASWRKSCPKRTCRSWITEPLDGNYRMTLTHMSWWAFHPPCRPPTVPSIVLLGSTVPQPSPRPAFGDPGATDTI